jgi:hypothetical protein
LEVDKEWLIEEFAKRHAVAGVALLVQRGWDARRDYADKE